MIGAKSVGVSFTFVVLAALSHARAVDYYWIGGNGNWPAGNSWREGSADGTLKTWLPAANAVFAGNPGRVTVGNVSNASTITAGTITFKVSGYALLPHATDANASTVTGNILLDPGVDLGLMNAAAAQTRLLNLNGSITGGPGASLTLRAGEAGQLNQIGMNTANADFAVPVVINGDNAAYAGFLSNATGVRISGDIANNSASTLFLAANTGADLTLSGKITGTGGVTFSANVGGGSGGNGTVVLTGQSTYSGTTTFIASSSSAVRLGIADALPTATALVFGQTATTGKLDLNDFNQTVASIEGGTSSVSSTITNDSAAAGTSVLTVNGQASTVYFGRIRDGAYGGKVAVVKAGTGTLSLKNSQAYTGTTTISGGTLELGTGGSIATSPVRMAGGTLAVAASHAATSLTSVDVVSGASAITSLGAQTGAFALGPVTRTGGATIAFTPPTTGTMTTTTANTAGTILGGWATAGTTTWAVSGVGATAGAITGLPTASFGSNYATVTASTNFDVTTSNAFSGSGANSLRFNTAAPTTASLPGGFVVGSGGVLVTGVVAGNAASIAGGTLTSGNGKDLIVHQHNATAVFTIGSTISDNAATPIGLTKSGAGTLALTAANTLTGTTAVNAGRLLANTPVAAGSATGSGAVVVRDGGQLAGTGNAAGPVTVESGGVLSAGSGTAAAATATDTVGTLSTGGQTWLAGGSLRTKYAGGTTAAAAGTGYDTLAMPTLNLADLAASGGVFKIVVLKTPGGLFNAAQDATLKLATVGAITTTAAGPAVGGNVDLSRYFALDTSSLGVSNSDDAVHFSVGTGSGGGDVLLFYDADGQAAPEPAGVVLTMLAGGAVLGRRRRVR